MLLPGLMHSKTTGTLPAPRFEHAHKMEHSAIAIQGHITSWPSMEVLARHMAEAS